MLSDLIAIIVQVVMIYFIIKVAFKITKFFIKFAAYVLAFAIALNVLRIFVLFIHILL